MALAAVLAFFLASAVAADWLTIVYHRDREAGRVNRTSLVSAALESLTWAPILAAVTTDSRTVWACAVVSVFGALVGTRIGMRREVPKQ